jgi:hypothetical protein
MSYAPRSLRRHAPRPPLAWHRVGERYEGVTPPFSNPPGARTQWNSGI